MDQEECSSERDMDWLSCAGKLHSLNAKMVASAEISREIETVSFPNQEKILKEIINISTQIKESTENVLETSLKVLRKLESSNTNIMAGSEEDTTMPAWDPGERLSNLSPSQKRYLLEVGPHQPILDRYPCNDTLISKETHKQCRFNPAWFQEYPHLEYSLSKGAAFCFVCSLFAHGPGHERAENAWVSEGVRSWHKFKSIGTKTQGKLAKHFSSKSHRNAVLSYAEFSNFSGHIDVILSKEQRAAYIQREADLERNRHVVEILLDVTKTLGRQGLAF